MAHQPRQVRRGELIAHADDFARLAPVTQGRALIPTPSNPVVHLELHTGDLPRAASSTRGCAAGNPNGSTSGSDAYLALGLGGGFGGGIVECETRRPLWLPYVEVADIAEATEQARRSAPRCCWSPARARRVAQRRRRARRWRGRLLAAEGVS